MKAIFAGSFNPFTIGHLNIVKKSLNVFSEVIIAVASDTAKQNVVDIRARCDIAKDSTKDLKGTTVLEFNGLLTEFASSQSTNFLIRGLRSEQDFALEKTLATVYKDLNKDIELIYFITDTKDSHISSSLVRELIKLNTPIDNYIVKTAKDKILKAYSNN